MKYILACLWLLCYFPFVNSFVSDENHRVTVYLENLQSFDDEMTYSQWQSCLSFLEQNHINCCIRLKCLARNIDDTRFVKFISSLEAKGNCILHSENCFCAKSRQISYQEAMPDHRGFDKLPVESTLSISLDPEYFRDRYISQVKKCDVLRVNGDPSFWTRKHFEHFKENIGYLLSLGIEFDIP